jgi:phosphoribosylamine--glycine ligase
MAKNILVVGGGGRCHAIVKGLRMSPKVDKIYAAPGNAGIAEIAECVDIKDCNVDGLLSFAKNNAIDLTIVGPELPLAMGIVDRFAAAGLRIFGPTKTAARIETSKIFAKDLMKQYAIPTAEYAAFEDYDSAIGYISAVNKFPLVLKYDGLAAGKGVVIAQSREDAENALADIFLHKKFGVGKVVVEEFLEGEEFSLMCFVNGNKVFPMELAQDYKRAFDGNEGPNTGGMGAYSPVPFVSKADLEFAMNNIMQKTADALVMEGCPFVGVLYGGLIKTASGIMVIEFNCRFGDPEAEVVLQRLYSDLYDIFEDVLDGTTPVIKWKPQCSLGITLAAKGYPNNYNKGSEITGFDKLNGLIYHMGTQRKDGRLLINGGRVLFVSALAVTIEQARRVVLDEIKKLDCPDLFWRSDIGR